MVLGVQERLYGCFISTAFWTQELGSVGLRASRKRLVACWYSAQRFMCCDRINPRTHKTLVWFRGIDTPLTFISKIHSTRKVRTTSITRDQLYHSGVRQPSLTIPMSPDATPKGDRLRLHSQLAEFMRFELADSN